MFLNHTILAICWIVYCVLHSVLANLRVKACLQQKTGRYFRFYRLFYTVFAAVTLGLVLAYQFSLESPRLFQSSTASLIIGSLVAITGVGLMFVCIKKYFFSLSGLKSLYEEAPSAELMIAGIHRYMRHPLYTGTFMAIWGLWILFPFLSLLIADVIITLYTLFAIRLEEAKLVAEFGDQYRRYQKTVPKLIPRM